MHHTSKISAIIAIIAGSALLSGCAQINALSKASTLNSLNNDLDAARSQAVTMPVSDTATYDGIAVFGASNDTVGVALVGDASMTADFDAATISGTIDNFVGAENVTADEQGNFSDLDGNPLSVTDLFLSVKSASGEVSVNNGTISGSTFSADYASAGGIVMSGSTYHPHGTMAGDFIGSNADMIEASASCDFTVNAACTDAVINEIDADETGLYLLANSN